MEDKAVGYELQRQNAQLLERVREMEQRMACVQNQNF